MTNFAGKTQIEVGTKIRITYILGDKEDRELVGQTGTITHPFGFTMGNEVCGVELDEKNGSYIENHINLLAGDRFVVIN